jgi:hypothetical protein
MWAKSFITVCLFVVSTSVFAIEYWMFQVVDASTQFEPTPQRVYELKPLDRIYGYGEASTENVTYVESEIVAHESIEEGAWVLLALYPSGRKFVMEVTQPETGLVSNDVVRAMLFDVITNGFDRQFKRHPLIMNNRIKVDMTLSEHMLPRVLLDNADGDNIGKMMVDYYLRKLMQPVSKYFQTPISVRFEISFRDKSLNVRMYNRSDKFSPVRDLYEPFQSLHSKYLPLTP